MMTITIDNPKIEEYFSNSSEKVKEFLEIFIQNDETFEKEFLENLDKRFKEIKDDKVELIDRKDIFNV